MKSEHMRNFIEIEDRIKAPTAIMAINFGLKTEKRKNSLLDQMISVNTLT